MSRPLLWKPEKDQQKATLSNREEGTRHAQQAADCSLARLKCLHLCSLFNHFSIFFGFQEALHAGMVEAHTEGRRVSSCLYGTGSKCRHCVVHILNSPGGETEAAVG